MAKEEGSDSGKKPWVVTKGDLRNFTGKQDYVVADFDTYEEASSYADQRNKSLGADERYRYIYMASERITSTGSGKALAKKKNKISKRVGDTLRDYKKNVEDAYRRAVNAKRDLTATVDRITKDNVRDVNQLIDQYNNLADEYNELLEKGKEVEPSLQSEKFYRGMAKLGYGDKRDKTDTATNKPRSGNKPNEEKPIK